MKIRSVKEIEPCKSRCIEVDSDNRLFAMSGNNGDAIVSHNSVVQRNIIIGTILRPEKWRLIGIDLKRVELSSFRAYSNVVLGVATELEQAVSALRLGQQIMMKRYTEMEEIGVKHFTDLPEIGQALMIMIDELGELTSSGGGSAKALAGSTLVQMADGTMKPLSEIKVGDKVLDAHSRPTVVVDKYEPVKQNRYNLSIRDESSDKKESFVAGAEHDWIVYLFAASGEVSLPLRWSTEQIFKFNEEQKLLPENERTKIKFKKWVDRGLL